MLSGVFLHLSDIHFGQETGSQLYIHNDVKEGLVEDVAGFVENEMGSPITGIIVSGDITYSGKESEFQEAGKWLDKLSTAGGCRQTDVYVVPGNHDIDRDQLSEAAKIMLEKIAKEGDDALDRCLKRDDDKEVLYGRLSSYRSFAEGYGCPLDLSGGHAGDAFSLELVPGRSIRFLGLNSALACSKKDVKGQLLLGAKQRVLRNQPGEALVVISHHPMNWFSDSNDAQKYVRRSASVFISGHEHLPSTTLVGLQKEELVLNISAGATIPPESSGEYNFTYNFLKFGWNVDSDSLIVRVYPRCWDNDEKRFSYDNSQSVTCSNEFVVPYKPPRQVQYTTVRDEQENNPVIEVAPLETVDERQMQDNRLVDRITLHFFATFQQKFVKKSLFHSVSFLKVGRRPLVTRLRRLCYAISYHKAEMRSWKSLSQKKWMKIEEIKK